ncbi:MULTISPECIES: roadblock/LC7 domain-containing protein [Nonomuraea]|uniref:Roadblock/LC7 domain-containing protein n=1 Tax=Nonomuraea mangrovi TaxID=2316207 RepID=A0ABW4SVU3_9ACTN
MSDLNWLLDDLVSRVPETEHGIVLSRDGLLMASSKGLDTADGERLAAMAAGLQSLAAGVGVHIGGGQVRQTVVELNSRFLIVTAAGQGACLAMVSSREADIGLVAYEMTLLVAQVGQALAAAPRLRPAAEPGTPRSADNGMRHGAEVTSAC